MLIFVFQAGNEYFLYVGKSNEVIPKEVVYILTASGFDSKFSIKNLTHESIKEIEGFFNTNYSELSNGLVGTRYENTRPFRILPGHQALIKSLP